MTDTVIHITISAKLKPLGSCSNTVPVLLQICHHDMTTIQYGNKAFITKPTPYGWCGRDVGPTVAHPLQIFWHGSNSVINLSRQTTVRVKFLKEVHYGINFVPYTEASICKITKYNCTSMYTLHIAKIYIDLNRISSLLYSWRGRECYQTPPHQAGFSKSGDAVHNNVKLSAGHRYCCILCVLLNMGVIIIIIITSLSSMWEDAVARASQLSYFVFLNYRVLSSS